MDKYKKVVQNDKFEISGTTWDKESKLPDGLIPYQYPQLF